MKRRDFLRSAAASAVGLALGCERRDDPDAELDAFFEERMARLHIPGLAGILVSNDGFLRTSVLQLASYLDCMLGGGPPILERETLDEMLQVQAAEIWGLAWYRREVQGRSGDTAAPTPASTPGSISAPRTGWERSSSRTRSWTRPPPRCGS